MWPWGHLAVGYLLYSIGLHAYARRAPDSRTAVAVAFGTQFPDLVDKPLAWTFGVLPNGRTLAHSVLVALLVIAAVEVVLRYRNRGEVATAFGVGYLSHLAGDALRPALAGDYYRLGFLGWPLVPPVDYASEPSFSAHLPSLASAEVAELAFAGVVVLFWLWDGAPGPGLLRAAPRWLIRTLSR